MRIADKERARTRAATNFTELWLVGTGDEITALTTAARNAGTLVYQSAPQPMGGTDPRHRVYLRLYLHRP
jgi:hypothetical protein